MAALSAGLPNTGVVATLASPIRSLAEAGGKAPSRYLMPLSFASILGGVVTVVGIAMVLVVGPRVLPHREDPLVVGQHLDLSGTCIARLDRNGETITDVRPDTQLLAGDVVTRVPRSW